MVRKPKDKAIQLELAPADIRRIREKLGLSQAEAGELLGGGPRAFTKYEAGAIKPAASVSNFLRMLDSDPAAAAKIRGKKVVPMDLDLTRRPNEVTGEHVAALTDRKMTALIRRVLNAEALGSGLPMDGIHVAANITTADDGEDARIEWKDGPARSRFLPDRLTQFQSKAGKIGPTKAAGDVLTKSGEVKTMVRDVLERGGTYIMMCGNSYVKTAIDERAKAIHESLVKAGLNVAADKVQFRDADQIASWVNIYPPVAEWLLEQTQPGLTGPFKTWTHWAGFYDDLQFVADQRLAEWRPKLRAIASESRAVGRVVGLSGVGATRLVHEAVSPSEDDQFPFLSDIVMYAVEEDVGSIAVKNVVQNLADSGFRAALVVDRCSEDTHQVLVGMVKRAGSRISLITIDDEATQARSPGGDIIAIERAGDSVIDGIIKQVAPGLPDDDQRRLVQFARGFPQMAVLLGRAWGTGAPLAAATPDNLLDRILLGRKPFNPELLKEAGMLLGAFRLLGDGHRLNDLTLVANFSRGRSADDLRAALDDLQQRGVVQRRGRLLSIQPKPLAMALAERQWRQWRQARWDSVLAGELPPILRERAADQLAMLNDRPIAIEVARHVARLDGPLASIEALYAEGNADVISALAAIDAEATVTLIEHVLSPLSAEQRREIDGSVRRNLVRALEKICFLAPTFERGALMMLDLAVSENEEWSNNSTGQFRGLFPILLPDTAASPETRLQLLDDLIQENDPLRMPIVIDALLTAARTGSHVRTVGPEIHGSRPALVPWRPKYWKEAWDYIVAVMDRLCSLALRKDACGAQARAGMAHEFRTLICAGLLDQVGRWVATVRPVHPYWPQALDSLGDVLQYDLEGLNEGEEAPVRKLIADLNPNDLPGRIRFIVTEMPWDYPVDEKLDYQERGKRQAAAVEDLAIEALNHPQQLRDALAGLSAGSQRNAAQFGIAIAKYAEHPEEWAEPIAAALRDADPDNRNFGLVAGYYAGMAKRDLPFVESWKAGAIKSPLFATAVPIICIHVGITSADLDLVIGGLKTGLVRVWAVRHWAGGRALESVAARSVASLLDQLFAMDAESYAAGLEILGMYVHGRPELLEQLRSQLRLVATNAHKLTKRPGATMDLHHFQELLHWLLKRGRDDTDARAVAEHLADWLAEDPAGDAADIVKPLLKPLLGAYASLVWPRLANAIVKDRAKAWRFEHILGDSFSFADEKTPAITYVPEEMLFAWCHAHPEAAPAFVAVTAPVLTTRNAETSSRALHPLIKRVLDEFGNRDDVRRAVVQNMHTFGWAGSRTTYYALYEEPLRSLENHPVGAVRRWSQSMRADLREQMASAKAEEDEREAHWDN